MGDREIRAALEQAQAEAHRSRTALEKAHAAQRGDREAARATIAQLEREIRRLTDQLEEAKKPARVATDSMACEQTPAATGDHDVLAEILDKIADAEPLATTKAPGRSPRPSRWKANLGTVVLGLVLNAIAVVALQQNLFIPAAIAGAFGVTALVIGLMSTR